MQREYACDDMMLESYIGWVNTWQQFFSSTLINDDISGMILAFSSYYIHNAEMYNHRRPRNAYSYKLIKAQGKANKVKQTTHNHVNFFFFFEKEIM